MISPAAPRSQNPDRYKWDLSHLFASAVDWHEGREALALALSLLAGSREAIGDSPQALAEILERRFTLERDLSRLSAYATLLVCEDSGIVAHRAMRQQIRQLSLTFRQMVAWIEPALASMPATRLTEWLTAEPRLAAFRAYIDDVIRRAPHILPEHDEELLADTERLGAAGVYRTLLEVELPYPSVEVGDGAAVLADQTGYVQLRGSQCRCDRRRTASAFLTTLGRFRRTFGAAMHAQLRRQLFLARRRGYSSPIEMGLDAAEIPAAVLGLLLEAVHRGLPILHRYLELRKKFLGLDELHYADLHVPLTTTADLRWPVELAREQIVAALAPLGPEYTRVVGQAFEQRWIDFLPNRGKPSGAFASGAVYGVHPYASVNYTGSYPDVSTLAHELGHMVHAVYANGSQALPAAHPRPLVAEVAALFNDELLARYMLRRHDGQSGLPGWIGSYLDNFRTILFRQTHFAVFHFELIEMSVRREAITGEMLSDRYLEMVREYYGHHRGVCKVDEEIGHEWIHIPQLFGSFSVFHYALAFVAASCLADRVLSGDEGHLQCYLGLLRAGCSNDPMSLLRDAGVDLTTEVPFDAALRRMSDAVDALERCRVRVVPGSVDDLRE